ncbi:MAG: DUF4364 family protein [Desulfurococcales archaeon]|nr:DUF4364 family protein [Desulfurococcales archaeon]
MRERTEHTVRLALNLLRLLHSYEGIGKKAGMYELVEALETNYHTLQRVVRALEKNGLIVVEPYEKKNVPRLTEQGRCVAKCLISGA